MYSQASSRYALRGRAVGTPPMLKQKILNEENESILVKQLHYQDKRESEEQHVFFFLFHLNCNSF
jgi:hypothetical protein